MGEGAVLHKTFVNSISPLQRSRKASSRKVPNLVFIS
jgi:hypothetical protein